MPSIRRVLRATAATTVAAALGLAISASAAPATAVAAHITDPEAVSWTGFSAVAPGSSYAFTSVVFGKPVRWNPCEAIHWRSNTSRGPVGGLDVVKAAVASVAAATGTHWIYDGATTTVPRVAVLNKTTIAAQPIVIGWTDSASSDLLAGKPASTAGITRTLWFSASSDAGTIAATRGAVVALNRNTRLPLRGGVSWQTAITHEVGHVMGLAHSRSTEQVMAPTLSPGIAQL
ncbi:MAG: matrixin family metalloprotease, partial [Mycobacteriales bacterium]